MRKDILHIMPMHMRSSIENSLRMHPDVEEIRIRIGRPFEVRCQEQSVFLAQTASAEDIDEMLTFISRYSIYAYEEEIRQGFLTIEGGNRVGFAGQVRMEHGQVARMTNIRFLNIRIAGERLGCARELLPWMYEGKELQNTLLISRPGAGKTTYLRDCVRMISDGEGTGDGRKVCVIDERSEIAACHLGIPQNDMGKRTDVLDGCPKQEGMRMALRSMSPDVIAVDELGGEGDAKAVEEMILSGCKMIGTMHGEQMEHIIQLPKMEEMYQKKLFQRYIFLEKKENGRRTFCVYNQESERLC